MNSERGEERRQTEEERREIYHLAKEREVVVSGGEKKAIKSEKGIMYRQRKGRKKRGKVMDCHPFVIHPSAS